MHTDLCWGTLQWGCELPFPGRAGPAGLGAEAGPWAHPSPPCSGLVRGQTEQSMAEVHPYRCADYLTKRNQNCTHSCCKDPEFGSIPAEVGSAGMAAMGEQLSPCP